MDHYTIVAECKGGIINTRHPGQKSRLRSGLCEAVGLLMAHEMNGDRLFAVVPDTEDTRRLAERIRPRCVSVGINVILMREDGIPVISA